jgi:hypothetical protein
MIRMIIVGLFGVIVGCAAQRVELPTPKVAEWSPPEDCPVAISVRVVSEDATALVISSPCLQDELLIAMSDAQLRALVAMLLRTQSGESGQLGL